MKNEFGTDMTFYLYLDLKDSNKGLERFQTLKEAVKRYQELPKEWSTALGGDVGRGVIDFVQRQKGQNVLIMDYEIAGSFKDRPETPEIIRILKEELALQLYFEASFAPYGGVVASIPSCNSLNDYFDDKLLFSPSIKSLNAGINEVLVMQFGNSFGEQKYMGWQRPKEFVEGLDEATKQNKNLYVQLLNVSYVDSSGYHGQADISPREFHLLKEKTKEYLKEYGKYPVPEQIKQDKARTHKEWER